MSDIEKAFRVTGRLTIDYQIILQAQHPDEAAYFATDIDLDRWRETSSDWQIIDVSRDYFLRQVKVEQPESAPTPIIPRIVTDSE
jgi:hypothetical protein